MAVVHSTALKVTIGTAVRGSLNDGSGSLEAVEFRTAGDAELTSIPLDTTPWGAADGSGIITAAITAPGEGIVAAGGGTCTKGAILDKDGADKITFTCGTSGQDVNFDNNVWEEDGVVTLTSLTYQAA